jgi:hypothetical protein
MPNAPAELAVMFCSVLIVSPFVPLVWSVNTPELSAVLIMAVVPEVKPLSALIELGIY